MDGSDWQGKTRPTGRTGRVAQNHCLNSKTVEHTLDWRPFDYFTVRYRRSPVEMTVTADLKALGAGTTLTWSMRMNGSLPRPVRRTTARLIAKHVMRIEEALATLDQLSLRSMMPQKLSNAA